jgi:hypothetical protein
MENFKYLYFLFCLFFLLSLARANMYQSVDSGKTKQNIKISFAAPRKASYLDKDGSYGNYSGDLSASLLLFRKVSKSSFFQIYGASISPTLEYNYIDHTFLKRGFYLYTIRPSFFILKRSDSGEFYTSVLGLSINGSNETIDDPDYKLLFMTTGTYHFTNNLTAIYGLGYSPLMGKFMLFPILGCKWRINDNLKLKIILPIEVTLSKVMGKKWLVSMFLRTYGKRIYFENENDFPGEKENLYYRESALKLGALSQHKILNEISMSFEGGFFLMRKVVIDDKEISKISFANEDNDAIISRDIKRAPYANITLTWNFGSSKDI